jgi:hypothetical protein
MTMLRGTIRSTPFGYKRITCPKCGEEKTVPTGTRYCARLDGKDLVWCSYNCFRTYAKKREECEKQRAAEKQAQEEAYERRHNLRVLKSNTRAQIKTAKANVEKYSKIIEASPCGSKARKNAQSSCGKWKRKLKKAYETLKEIEEAK